MCNQNLNVRISFFLHVTFMLFDIWLNFSRFIVRIARTNISSPTLQHRSSGGRGNLCWFHSRKNFVPPTHAFFFSDRRNCMIVSLGGIFSGLRFRLRPRTLYWLCESWTCLAFECWDDLKINAPYSHPKSGILIYRCLQMWLWHDSECGIEMQDGGF